MKVGIKLKNEIIGKLEKLCEYNVHTFHSYIQRNIYVFYVIYNMSISIFSYISKLYQFTYITYVIIWMYVFPLNFRGWISKKTKLTLLSLCITTFPLISTPTYFHHATIIQLAIERYMNFLKIGAEYSGILRRQVDCCAEQPL